ncbi:MAG: hypothetical protein P4M13_08405 [Alphaproteobacteria bacterium]|nr:hypothetical protein [Alphaproteobacteria bacterium]
MTNMVTNKEIRHIGFCSNVLAISAAMNAKYKEAIIPSAQEKTTHPEIAMRLQAIRTQVKAASNQKTNLPTNTKTVARAWAGLGNNNPRPSGFI